jgi:hypothetical protein
MSEEEQILRTIIENTMYGAYMGKSSLWLFGNVSLLIFFLTILFFLIRLNIKEKRKTGIVSESKLTKIKYFFQEKYRDFYNELPSNSVKYISNSFDFLKLVWQYKEILICLFVFLRIAVSLSWIFAGISFVIYFLFRVFLLPKIKKLFVLKENQIISIGAIFAFVLLYLILAFLFNFFPALVEVSAQNAVMQTFSDGVFE